MTWFAGSDHAGLSLGRPLVALLRELGDEVIDLGSHADTSVDDPGYGADVGRRVADTPGAFVRCAVVHDTFTAEVARQHNNANVVALGARVIGPGVARPGP